MKLKISGIMAILLICIPFLLQSANATQLSTPDILVNSGEQVQVPLNIDQVDNLAGMKIVLSYDPKILTYKKGFKSQVTGSLMHIVNDKNPGKLIIVMAGAQGIKGEQATLFNMIFKASEKSGSGIKTPIRFQETQLMGDDLKEIDHDSRGGLVTVLKTPAIQAGNK